MPSSVMTIALIRGAAFAASTGASWAPAIVSTLNSVASPSEVPYVPARRTTSRRFRKKPLRRMSIPAVETVLS